MFVCLSLFLSSPEVLGRLKLKQEIYFVLSLWMITLKIFLASNKFEKKYELYVFTTFPTALPFKEDGGFVYFTLGLLIG